MAVHQWIADYRVGVVESIQESGGKGTKALKICQVHLGDDDNNTITVVTSAPNVRLKSRLAVAPVGSTVLAPSGGEPLLITKTSVGGVMSEGMFCDARMLAWDGGSEGIAAQIDASVPLGAPPPLHKPRPQHNKNNAGQQETAQLPESQVEGLFEKKLTKEEKKAAAKAAREAKKAAKEAKKAAEES